MCTVKKRPFALACSCGWYAGFIVSTHMLHSFILVSNFAAILFIFQWEQVLPW
jgi:hypothetical protein